MTFVFILCYRMRHLRNLDRAQNSDRYPQLYFPEIYLLEGGYNVFYEGAQVGTETVLYLNCTEDNTPYTRWKTKCANIDPTLRIIAMRVEYEWGCKKTIL